MKTGKRFLSIILVVLMLLTAAPLAGFVGLEIAPKTEALEDASGKCGDHVYWSFVASSGELMISGEGPMNDGYGFPFDEHQIRSVTIGNGVTNIGAGMFYGCDCLTSVLIWDTVTSIGNYAFFNCSNLIGVEIPDSVKSIGRGAFEGCTGLMFVNIPNGVERIEDDTFAACGLVNVSIPDSVKSIGSWAFSHCDMPSVIIPDSVTYIGDFAFYWCESLEDISIGSGVTRIGEEAFCGCNMTSVTIPNGVESIDCLAFSSCKRLKNVLIPNSVTYIGGGAFRDCPSLKSVVVNKDNAEYTSDETGVLYDKNKTELIQYPISSDRSSFEIPPGVEGIGSYAFRDCKNLRKVIIPNSVTYIDDSSFMNCSNLKNVIFGNSLKTIGPSAFKGCSFLTGVVFPDSMKSISYGAFSGCSSLTSVAFPDSMKSIGYRAFSGCSSLTSVTIGDNLKEIEDGAFRGCTAIKDVYYTGAENWWNWIRIGTDNECLTNATIHFGFVPEHNSVFGTDDDLNQSISFGVGKSVWITLNRQWFSYSNRFYNHDLARFCAAFSMLGYGGQNITTYLRNCGFQVLDSNMYAARDAVNTFVAVKTITIDGCQKNLIFVGTIGSYQEQWYSDFDPYGKDRKVSYAGDIEKGETHLGFADARDYAYEMMERALRLNGLDLNVEDNILLFTGHSRGAAAANLLAAKVINEARQEGKWANSDKIFAYTFATPNTTIIDKVNENDYPSIFNIVNPEDFVTKVMLHSWDYGRYGVTYTLPSKTNTDPDLYADDLAAMRWKFRSFTNEREYEPFALGEFETWNVINTMSKNVPSVEDFYDTPLYLGKSIDAYKPYDFFTKCILKIIAPCSDNDLIDGALTMVRIRQNLTTHLLYRGLLDYFFFDVSFLSSILSGNSMYNGSFNDLADYLCFARAHQMETYCAFMYTLSADRMEDMRKKEGYKGSVNCPVDVEIINNKTGEVVGRIVDNVVDEVILAKENSVIMVVEGDEKTFWLPSDGDYEVKLIGNDGGTMDYTLSEMDSDTGERIRTNFFEVPLTDGLVYTSEVDEAFDIEDYTITSETGTVIAPNETFDSENATEFTVTAKAEENGFAEGGATYTSGDYATVNAFPNEGYVFDGWFVNDELVSPDANYRFRVDADMTLTAHFKPCIHQYTETVATAPTCTTTGESTIACSLCGFSYTETIPALGHTDDNNDGHCDACGEQMTGGDHCKFCGKIHNGGFFDKLTGFFHKIFAIFKR